MLIEAKKYGAPLQVEQESQLFRYFTATSARFGILTDGVFYRFFSDLDESKVMDQKPFFEFNMLDFTDAQVEQLKRFHKENFNLNATIEAAREAKYTNEVKRVLAEEFANPSRELVHMIARRVHGGGTSAAVRRQFESLAKTAFSQFISDRINARLKSALESGNHALPEADASQEVRPPKPPVELPRDLYMDTMTGIKAKAREDTEGVVVLEGSMVGKKAAPTLNAALRQRRETALAEGRCWSRKGSSTGLRKTNGSTHSVRQPHMCSASQRAALPRGGVRTVGVLARPDK